MRFTTAITFNGNGWRTITMKEIKAAQTRRAWRTALGSIRNYFSNRRMHKSATTVLATAGIIGLTVQAYA